MQRSFEDKKNHLSKYIPLQNKYLILRELHGDVGSIKYGVVKTTSRLTQVEKIAKLDLLEAKMKLIENDIYNVSDSNDELILECRYIHGMTICSIAEQLGYDERHIKRMINKAIDRFTYIKEVEDLDKEESE